MLGHITLDNHTLEMNNKIIHDKIQRKGYYKMLDIAKRHQNRYYTFDEEYLELYIANKRNFTYFTLDETKYFTIIGSVNIYNDGFYLIIIYDNDSIGYLPLKSKLYELRDIPRIYRILYKYNKSDRKTLKEKLIDNISTMIKESVQRLLDSGKATETQKKECNEILNMSNNDISKQYIAFNL